MLAYSIARKIKELFELFLFTKPHWRPGEQLVAWEVEVDLFMGLWLGMSQHSSVHEIFPPVNFLVTFNRNMCKPNSRQGHNAQIQMARNCLILFCVFHLAPPTA